MDPPRPSKPRQNPRQARIPQNPPKSPIFPIFEPSDRQNRSKSGILRDFEGSEASKTAKIGVFRGFWGQKPSKIGKNRGFSPILTSFLRDFDRVRRVSKTIEKWSNFRKISLLEVPPRATGVHRRDFRPFQRSKIDKMTFVSSVRVDFRPLQKVAKSEPDPKKPQNDLWRIPGV